MSKQEETEEGVSTLLKVTGWITAVLVAIALVGGVISFGTFLLGAGVLSIIVALGAVAVLTHTIVSGSRMFGALFNAIEEQFNKVGKAVNQKADK